VTALRARGTPIAEVSEGAKAIARATEARALIQ
jgi:hypothetical protein